MSKEKGGISIFQKYLTVWVILCMAAGILIGKFLPQIDALINRIILPRKGMVVSGRSQRGFY